MTHTEATQLLEEMARAQIAAYGRTHGSGQKVKALKQAIAALALVPDLMREVDFAQSRTEALLDAESAVYELEAEDMFGSPYGKMLRDDVKAYQKVLKRAKRAGFEASDEG